MGKTRKGVGENFARKHLKQKGWTKGSGLGLTGQGMVDAIKPKLKFDNSGLGFDQREEFAFHWWDHVFNKAAQSIEVEQDAEGEVVVNYSNDKDLSVKKSKRKKKLDEKKKNILYSNFVKSGTLVGGKLESKDNDNEEIIDEDLSKTLTDEELVKACGGLTAHKGARHGHKMSAKLKRIEAAEQRFLDEFKEKRDAKLDKRIKNVTSKKELIIDSVDIKDTKDISPNEIVADNETVESSKKKRKRREQILDETPNNSSEDLPLLKKKKKKKKKHLKEFAH